MTTLNEQLNDALKLVGDTPLKEPELNKAFDEESPDKVAIVEEVLQRSKLDIDSFTGMEIAEFYGALVEHVRGFKTDDGSFKVTPATENCNLPNFREAEAITRAGREFRVVMGEMRADDPDSIEAYRKALENLSEVVWPVSGLNRDDMTLWEQSLVQAQIIASTVAIEETATGKLF